MKTILVVLAILTLSISVSASFIGTETSTKSGLTTEKLLVQEPIGKSGLGAFAYACQNKYWGQAYAGLTYFRPGKINTEVAFGYGVESVANDSGRLGGWVWAGKNKLSAIYVFENGGSGSWTKLEVKYQLSPKLAVGYVNQDFVGEGPLVECKLSHNMSVKYYATDITPVVHFALNF